MGSQIIQYENSGFNVSGPNRPGSTEPSFWDYVITTAGYLPVVGWTAGTYQTLQKITKSSGVYDNVYSVGGNGTVYQNFQPTNPYQDNYNSILGQFYDLYGAGENITISIPFKDITSGTNISLFATTYYTYSNLHIDNPKGASASVGIPVKPADVINGYVNLSGHPVSSGQQVTVSQNHEGTITHFIEYTNSNGIVNFIGQPGDSYSISVNTPSGLESSIARSVSATDYNTTPISLNLTTGYISFDESGLPGISWTVNFNGQSKSSTASSITFSASYGDYSYSISTSQGFAISPQSGSISLSKIQQQQNVSISLATSDLVQGTAYMNGLPDPGASLKVVNYSTSNPTDSYITANSNGQYQFHVAPLTEYLLTGTGRKIGGDLIYPADYEGGIYNLYFTNLTFKETGILGSNSWTVALSGLVTPANIQSYTTSTSGSTVTIPVVGNETYGYEITPPNDYVPNPRSSNVNVGETTTQVNISFTAHTTYSVTFSSNLASGDYWMVYLAGEGKSSTSPSVTYSGIPDGSYSWSASKSYEGTYPRGHYMVPNPSSGTVTVSGSNVNVQLTYYPQNSVSGNTPILMANGTYVLAKDITVGMHISTYNTTTHSMQNGVVLTVTKDSQNTAYIVNGVLNLSSNQLVLTNNGWMQAKNLSKGDLMMNPFTGHYTRVHSIQIDHGNFTMYGFVVGTNDNYIAWNYVLYGT